MSGISLVSVLAGALALGGCGDGSIGDGDGGNGGGDGGGNGGVDAANPNGGIDAAVNPEACKRVDLVFSLDGSSSMDEEKMAMSQDVFPGFATALLTVGGGLEDYRVGVDDACPDPANYHTQGASNPDCMFQGGNVWMESSSDALAAEFGCVADLWLGDQNCSGDNDDEQPASTAAASLEPPYSTGANAGFRRNDALLVVVAITDEDEQPTGAAFTAQEVYDRLIADAGGDVQRMVFLGIGGASACTGVYGTAEDAQKLRAISDLFIAQERGVFWDLCNGRLEDGLTEAMEVIEQACAELPPIP